jgi:hypothetical protein
MVGLASALLPNTIPSFGLIFVFCPAQAQEENMFHLVGFDTEVTPWCGDVPGLFYQSLAQINACSDWCCRLALSDPFDEDLLSALR